MINFTLVIQACNFYIVYRLLRILFFKPAITVLHEERSIKQDLQLHINITKVLIAQLNQEQEDQLYQFKQITAQRAPDTQYHDLILLKNIIPPLHIQELSNEQIAMLEHELSKTIVKEIGQVYE